jgi:hypothetical protein
MDSRSQELLGPGLADRQRRHSKFFSTECVPNERTDSTDNGVSFARTGLLGLSKL